MIRARVKCKNIKPNERKHVPTKGSITVGVISLGTLPANLTKGIHLFSGPFLSLGGIHQKKTDGKESQAQEQRIEHG